MFQASRIGRPSAPAGLAAQPFLYKPPMGRGVAVDVLYGLPDNVRVGGLRNTGDAVKNLRGIVAIIEIVERVGTPKCI